MNHNRKTMLLPRAAAIMLTLAMAAAPVRADSMTFTQSIDEAKFEALQDAWIPLAGERALVTVAGVIKTHISGTKSARRVVLNINLRLPPSFVAALKTKNKSFQVEQRVPFVTPNAMSGSDASLWAIDHFQGPANVATNADFLIQAMAVVEGEAAQLLRIGYHVTLVGKLVDRVQKDSGDVEPPPPKEQDRVL